MKEGVHIETSSSFDIDLIFKLHEEGELTTKTIIVHNGYKTEDYLEKIIKLNRAGFKNSILVLDSKSEIKRVKKYAKDYEGVLKLGIRMAIDEEPQSAYYTSRLGIRPSEIVPFYEKEIKNDAGLSLKMFHFFIDSGIKDTMYYWGEFRKAVQLYIDLKKKCPELRSLNLGGGFPIRNHLGFEYDYEYMIDEIVSSIKSACVEAEVNEPDIFTEFGKYTVRGKRSRHL